MPFVSLRDSLNSGLCDSNYNKNSMLVNSIIGVTMVATQLIAVPIVVIGGTILLIGAAGEQLIMGNTTQTHSVMQKINATEKEMEQAFLHMLIN
jgi:hypothetical protein